MNRLFILTFLFMSTISCHNIIDNCSEAERNKKIIEKRRVSDMLTHGCWSLYKYSDLNKEDSLVSYNFPNSLVFLKTKEILNLASEKIGEWDYNIVKFDNNQIRSLSSIRLDFYEPSMKNIIPCCYYSNLKISDSIMFISRVENKRIRRLVFRRCINDKKELHTLE